MSIIIASIDHLSRVVYMATDHRSMDLEGNFISDNNTKIFNIREGVLYGMSGLTSECLRMKDLLLDNKTLAASELIKLAENFAVKSVTHNGNTHGATFVLAGVYDDGKPFIWSRITDEKEHDVPEEAGWGYLEAKVDSLVRLPSLFISAPNTSTVNSVQPRFVEFVIKTGSYSKAILLSVGAASKIDKAVSPSVDLHQFDTATMKGLYEKTTLKTL